MKYIFPRQFGLHNVFTSAIDKSKTTQPFMDYTLREQELSSQGNQGAPNHLPSKRRVPKRLQGSCVKIVQKLQLRHSRCSYVEMIRHYCPTPYLEDFTATQAGEPNTKSLIDAATPIQHVSAFCQAIISRIIPHELFGVGRDGGENRQIVMQNIDRFIRCSRFENLTLHAVCQDLKVCCVQWLVPRGLKPGIKISISDFEKRKEILFELIYYIFDSLLVPLLRSNFHITESNTHKNRLFFFRHDVWRVLTEPSITHIKRTMLQELSTKEAAGILEPRNLGYSHMRVVPKGAGVRPIMNLKQRNTTLRNGKTVFGKAINSVIKPVQSMINCERTRHPDLAGASLFSVGDIYPKLKALQGRMKSKFPNGNKPLYFAKVDVQACFDTIPQANATKLMTKICSEPEYRVYYLAQIQQRDGRAYKVTKSAKQTKPMRKFLIPATSSRDSGISHEELVDSKLVKGKTNTIFSGSAVKTTKQRWPLVKLLQTHVEQNVVRIGKKFYRQKQGIPQGSTVSSLLCNLFYADFERECLAFLSEELPQDESLLLRLTDDFLLITTEREKAVRFLEIMHAGNESYGITVKRQKTLVNFDCKVDDENLSKTAGRQSFPYCGTVIDTQTLEITRDIEKRKENGMFCMLHNLDAS